MTAAERGFLLLSSHLGDERRRVLTGPQLRELTRRMQRAERKYEERELNESDLIALGYGRDFARRVVELLRDEELSDSYLRYAARRNCFPITRVSEGYPLILRKRLGEESPGVLWGRGDASLLSEPSVALVGSRDLNAANRAFAAEVGVQAARQGYVLVSGNARGADRTAQEACLKAGGKVISIVADELVDQREHENVLYLSEDGIAEAFSAQRALSRNRIIHALGLKTFVAQSSLRMGGTWDGTVKNLRFGWSSVFCFDDGSEAAHQLCMMGANPVSMDDLTAIYDLTDAAERFFSV